MEGGGARGLNYAAWRGPNISFAGIKKSIRLQRLGKMTEQSSLKIGVGEQQIEHRPTFNTTS